MLVLTRKIGEAIVVSGLAGLARELKISVVDMRNGRVRLGFEAESDVAIDRSEVWERKIADGTLPANGKPGSAIAERRAARTQDD